ncbi:E3 ubiquitin/ISG15 ligase TRIM25 [Xenopus laevis]|uniref:E3 ubiquitin/ISG15 ligase TRIM25 n=2 Tax=Xenopus laevis TaxID=8355 RepID=A0A1L8FQ28_XENLA|nr:E3 ubiquitin/ISG15 ligase TRIM25 [Xenopus laevis]XP_018079591.1 E3 ubiquitin/ISG15 ligase TRIM25 [Xenopus laevis]XP_018079592.1 E3 ubiquitin/ISG15 ligase TRIM25 [Xenopus laevis]OCT73690.1 hypothetical protein XELAEV_18032653mg [Xenopus laevis]
MASTDLRDELNCSICLSVYTDPVSLPCAHNFCRGCIGSALNSQDAVGTYFCPDCRAGFQERPALQRNIKLGNIAERFLSAQPEPEETEIVCTYCVHSPVPAAKYCILCEASLCETHLRVHSKSAEHVLTEPTASSLNRKCSKHKRILEYHCCDDGACICVSCWVGEEHRGHKVELLSEACKKQQEKLRNTLEKLGPEKDETEKRVQSLKECSKNITEKAAGETERVTDLFREIREQLEALEKRALSEISRQKDKRLFQVTDLIHQLEIKKDELSRKIRHIEELCNMADPLVLLQERKDGAEGADNESNGGDDKTLFVEDLDVGFISEILLTSLAGIVTEAKGMICGQEATGMLLDINTAANNVVVPGDRKSASYSRTDQRIPQTPERFQYHGQILSTRSFHTGRYYWDVVGNESGYWGIGVTYPSIKRRGIESCIGNNNKSWGLYREKNKYSVRYDSKVTDILYSPSCGRIRISLDYEAGRLSFYELSEPIRHLHTFTVTFTEPLHAVFCLWNYGEWLRIIS